VVVLAALAFILLKGRGNTFFGDDYVWMETRRSGLKAILDSYVEHIAIVPIATYQLLFHTVGIAHFRYYRLLAVLGHLACVTAVFVFARKRVGFISLAPIVPLAVFGAGYEFLLAPVNFGYPVSMAAGIFALVLLDRDRRRDSATACCLLCAGLLFSEFALLFAAGIAVELMLRDRSLRRWWVWGVPLILYVAWWLGFYQPSAGEHDLAAMPHFVAQLAASAAGGLLGLGMARGWWVLLALGIVAGVQLLRRRAISPRLVCLVVALISYWMLVSFGRGQLGTPWLSRYVYPGAVFLLLILLELFRGIQPPSWALLGVCVLSGASLIGNLRALNSGEGVLFAASRTVAAELGGLQLARAVAPSNLILDPIWAPWIIAHEYFAAVRALRSSPADSVSEINQGSEKTGALADYGLVRAGEVEMREVAGPVLRSASPLKVGLAYGGTYTRAGLCVRFRPGWSGGTLEFSLPRGGVELWPFGVRSALGTSVMVRRFASSYIGPIATAPAWRPVELVAAQDSDPQPWYAQISTWQMTEVCPVRSTQVTIGN
jgi:hypothetical protein